LLKLLYFPRVNEQLNIKIPFASNRQVRSEINKLIFQASNSDGQAQQDCYGKREKFVFKLKTSIVTT